MKSGLCLGIHLFFLLLSIASADELEEELKVGRNLLNSLPNLDKPLSISYYMEISMAGKIPGCGEVLIETRKSENGMIFVSQGSGLLKSENTILSSKTEAAWDLKFNPISFEETGSGKVNGIDFTSVRKATLSNGKVTITYTLNGKTVEREVAIVPEKVVWTVSKGILMHFLKGSDARVFALYELDPQGDLGSSEVEAEDLTKPLRPKKQPAGKVTAMRYVITKDPNGEMGMDISRPGQAVQTRVEYDKLGNLTRSVVFAVGFDGTHILEKGKPLQVSEIKVVDKKRFDELKAKLQE